VGIEVRLDGTLKVLLPTCQRKNERYVCVKELADGDWVDGQQTRPGGCDHQNDCHLPDGAALRED
jgi:hypothetical protein